MPPFTTSTSSVSHSETDGPADVDVINLQSELPQARNPSLGFEFPSRPLARSLMGSSETISSSFGVPALEREKALGISSPFLSSPPGPANMEWPSQLPQQSFSSSSSQIGSHDSLGDHEALPLLTSMIESNSNGLSKRNQLDFHADTSPFKSPAAGLSSSVDVIPKLCSTPSHQSSNSFSGFSRIPSNVASHRRVPNSHDYGLLESRPLFQVISKSPPSPIRVCGSQIEWEGREKYSVASFSSKSPITLLFDILPPSATSSNFPCDGRSPNSHPYSQTGLLSSRLSLWETILSLPRLTICFFQFLIASLIGVFSQLDLMFRNNSFGDTTGSPKFRRKKIVSLIAVVYLVFCVLNFSYSVFVKLGLIDENILVSPNLTGGGLASRTDCSRWTCFFSLSKPLEEEAETKIDDWNVQAALRRRLNPLIAFDTINNSSSSVVYRDNSPLNSMSHVARFNKLHSKLGNGFAEEVNPLLFQATDTFEEGSIAACLYSNHYWLDRLSDFVQHWSGPVSLVVECFSSDRPRIIRRIEELRERDLGVKQRVDFHLVSTPEISPIQKLQKAHHMLLEPIATNAHLNIARFFSRADMVWLVGDARVLPSTGLYHSLMQRSNLRTRVLDYGDAIIIPNFAFPRKKATYLSTSQWMKEDWNSEKLAQEYINQTLSSIPLSTQEWPSTPQDLLRLTTTRNDQDSNSTTMILYDQGWEPAKGPTNWTMWQSFWTTAYYGATQASETLPDTFKTNEVSGKHDEMYPIVNYDLNYAPNVIVSREGQPWCTERFEFNKAACVYQMYLTGTELWVMPEAWSLTIQQVSNRVRKSDSQALQELISSRLYDKFHQEACMHYGREFASMDAWDDARSKHARAICMHVLSSWGVGISSDTLIV